MATDSTAKREDPTEADKKSAKSRGAQITVTSSCYRVWQNGKYMPCRTIVGVRAYLKTLPVIQKQSNLVLDAQQQGELLESHSIDKAEELTDKNLQSSPAQPVVSCLYVEKNGCYFDLPGADAWDQERDARTYSGPNPVVAHPPCQRWGKMWAGSPMVINRTGKRKTKGDDNGCFAAALHATRLNGGVLEHPWGSHAWKWFGLNKPDRKGGWIKADEMNGWTCCVEQGRYGHYAPKPTLLYAVRCKLPELRWGVYEVKDSDFPDWAIEKHGAKRCRKIGLLCFKGGGVDSSPRISTPVEFRDLLIGMALSVYDN